MKSSSVALRLKPDTKSRLEALGKKRDRKPHYLMTIAIERFLEAEEALENERQLVAERWEEYATTGEALDHSDVKAWAKSLLSSQAS